MEPLIATVRPWPFYRRIALLFLTTYCAFVFLDIILSSMPFAFRPWDPLIAWVGQHLLHMEGALYPTLTGSGDTAYAYTQRFCWLVVALIVALVWTLADRKRPGYYKLAHWLRIGVRYYLAYFLLVYGSVKVIQLQFPGLTFGRLTETYGESSPMGLAWTFMGLSRGYNFFTGSAELLAGLLLFFRRTTLLGALLATVVMANVVAINFCFDVPVKLFSMELLLLAIYLAAKDGRRLLNLIVLNRPTMTVVLYPHKPARWRYWLAIGLKTVFILLALNNTLVAALKQAGGYPNPPLYGLYRVKTFVQRGDTIPPLLTDSVRWQEFIVDYPGSAVIKTMPGQHWWQQTTIDEKLHQIKIQASDDTAKVLVFHYEEIKPNKLVFRNDSMQITMKRYDKKDFMLTNRGFHWISEYPFNW